MRNDYLPILKNFKTQITLHPIHSLHVSFFYDQVYTPLQSSGNCTSTAAYPPATPFTLLLHVKTQADLFHLHCTSTFVAPPFHRGLDVLQLLSLHLHDLAPIQVLFISL